MIEAQHLSKHYTVGGQAVAALDDFSVVVEPGTPALKDIVAYFGQSVLKEDGALDRAKVGEIVFGDAEKRKTLEGFIYPRLFEEYARRIKEIGEKDSDALVLANTICVSRT